MPLFIARVIKSILLIISLCAVFYKDLVQCTNTILQLLVIFFPPTLSNVVMKILTGDPSDAT